MADIPDAVLARLRREAGPRCGYCRTSSKITGQPLTVEHLTPVARGGSSDEDNLWLAWLGQAFLNKVGSGVEPRVCLRS